MKTLQPLFGAFKNMDPTNRAGAITLVCIVVGILLFAFGVQIGKFLATL